MLAVLQQTAPSLATFAPLGLAALLFPIAALASSVIIQSWIRFGEGNSERMDLRLRNVREQMRVVYEMASTLSTSLNYSRVLEMVMDVSVHGLERLGLSTRVASAILLFSEESGETFLRVAACRRLTPADARAKVAGLEGTLGEVLKQAEPIISYNPHDDPELKYFAAFRESKAVLCIPMRAGFESFGVLVLGIPVRRRFRDDHVELMQVVANQAIVSLQNASLYQTLLEEKERIVEIDEEARKQLARDLHDGPTQTISAVAMRVSFIRRLMETKPGQASDELWKVEEMARKAAGEIRHMLFTLRPLVLEAQGLVAALEQLAMKMEETHQQKVTIQAQPNCEQYLDLQAQGVIFYIVEEAVNNARKHAEVDIIKVRLGVRADVLVVEIRDDGKGFDLEAVDANYEDRGSLGLINLRERAELVEGTLHIETAPGRGTRISLLVPLERSGGKLPSTQGRT
jgi:signal transduction histidine kinase